MARGIFLHILYSRNETMLIVRKTLSIERGYLKVKESVIY